MDSTKPTYATFLFEWTVKSTSYQIRYRKAFNINDIDEIFCSIINAKGNEINFSELAILLGFNLQDLAEKDILNLYLKGLTEYDLIEIDKEEIKLTDFGQEALQSKLKYKYHFATTELFENQTATGENFDFSFKSVFGLENRLTHDREIEKSIFENTELKEKLQFQVFGNDIYKGEIVELYESNSHISYKIISLQVEVSNSFQLSIFKSGANKPDIEFLIDLAENAELKEELLRKGMYYHILTEKPSIKVQDIELYKDLWNWKELAENPKVDWSDKTIFELFRENGNGNVWGVISQNAPIESIKSVIKDYAEYWNWTTLAERFDDNFIKEQIETFDWDFEELSYKETELVTSLLTNSELKDKDWDWNYLSKNLPDKFIEEHIEDFSWDFYSITESKNDVFKNTFIKYKDKLETLISKNWNWKFISEEININFLYKNISGLASKVNWETVLKRFFNNDETTYKCLKEESFKSLLKQHLPENFVVAHQKYLWTPDLIDFFEKQSLIQWETQSYIQGFDTNENVEWSKAIFQKYHNRITTENGFLNVSQRISDYSLIEQFPDFAWDWQGISQNKNLISNTSFIENAFSGQLQFSNNLIWNEILQQSNFSVDFWNNHLGIFFNSTESEKHIAFWHLLTQKESIDFIFENSHFPWDWSFITKISSAGAILDSLENKELVEKWDWEIATKKLDKEILLENLEPLTRYVDWIYIINDVFKDEIVFDNLKLGIANRLLVLDADKRKEVWKVLTAKYPFDKIYSYVQKTYEYPMWDWDYISNHELFPTDIRTLNQFREKINWTIFSESKSIKRKFEFNKTEWLYQEYFRYVLKYLRTFKNYWDWDKLTQNSNLHYTREFIRTFQDKWDWEYLSEFGGFLIQKKRDEANYLSALLSEFSKIQFEILSKRKDIVIDSKLIIELRDKNWDWQILSENEKAEISNELILNLQNKNWNWKALSKRKNIEFSNETLLHLLEKNWDWNYLSANENLEFNADFIEKTKTKSWNWQSVSRHKSFLPTVEILTLTKDYDLDWKHLSRHLSLSPTKEILAKFEDKWNWQSITENPQINFVDIDFVERFVDKWDWHFICKQGEINLNSQILSKFKEHLDWNLISSNTNIQFTIEIIQEFYAFWNWTKLKENKRIEDLCLKYFVLNTIEQDSTLYFIDKIAEQRSRWEECVFHFTNIDNAVKIIKEGKIKSRTTANQISNSSGILTYKTRKDPENFARFYFRTGTPTQYYNEGLFFPNNEEKYRNLGYPKCPIMIYFKVSLQEILLKNKHLTNVYLSNGNMQRNRTKYGLLEDMIRLFFYEELFKNNHEEGNGYYSQQELMFLSDVSIVDLASLEVVLEKESDRELIVRMLGNDYRKFKICVDRTLYENKNDRPVVVFNEEDVEIKADYNQEGYFTAYFENFIPKNLEGNIIKIDEPNKIIYFKNNLKFPLTFQDFQIEFFEEIENVKQKWTIGTQMEFKYENKTYKRKYF